MSFERNMNNKEQRQRFYADTTQCQDAALVNPWKFPKSHLRLLINTHTHTHTQTCIRWGTHQCSCRDASPAFMFVNYNPTLPAGNKSGIKNLPNFPHDRKKRRWRHVCEIQKLEHACFMFRIQFPEARSERKRRCKSLERNSDSRVFSRYTRRLCC